MSAYFGGIGSPFFDFAIFLAQLWGFFVDSACRLTVSHSEHVFLFALCCLWSGTCMSFDKVSFILSFVDWAFGLSGPSRPVKFVVRFDSCVVWGGTESKLTCRHRIVCSCSICWLIFFWWIALAYLLKDHWVINSSIYFWIPNCIPQIIACPLITVCSASTAGPWSPQLSELRHGEVRVVRFAFQRCPESPGYYELPHEFKDLLTNFCGEKKMPKNFPREFCDCRRVWGALLP